MPRTLFSISLKVWIICYRLDIFDEMSASEELDDNQVRQILFDLDSAYNAFNRILHDNWNTSWNMNVVLCVTQDLDFLIVT